MSRWLSLVLLLGIILVVAAAFYRVMIGFLLPLFMAAIFVILFRPFHNWFVRSCKGRERLAAALTTVSVLLMVVLPMGLVLVLAAVEASTLSAHLDERSIQDKLDNLRQKLDLEYEYEEEIRYLEASLETLQADAQHGATARGQPLAYRRLVDVANGLYDSMAEQQMPVDKIKAVQKAFDALAQLAQDPQQLGTLPYQRLLRDAILTLRSFKVDLLDGELRTWLKEIANPTSTEIANIAGKLFAGAPGFLRSVGGATSGLLLKLVFQSIVFVLSIYFFLTDGPAMLETVMRLSPLNDAYERELIADFDRISRAVVLATLASAAAQGFLAGLGFWLAGVNAMFLLSVLTIVFALIPFVGAASVWLPTCLWLYFYEERTWPAIVLAIYGAVIVSTVDNLIKPLVLHGQSNLHPLLALLSVLGGVQAIGPIGILVGPMVVVYLQTLLNILRRELTTADLKAVDLKPVDLKPADVKTVDVLAVDVKTEGS